MRKVLFIDRDGVILVEPPDEQIDSFEKFAFMPSAISSLSKIARELDYDLVMVTNQDGLGTESFPTEQFEPLQQKLLQILQAEGVVFKDIFIDPSFAHENKPTRKPGTAMLQKYIYGNYDLTNSFVIGDRATDMQLAKNLGTKSIYLSAKVDAESTFTASDWNKVYQYLKQQPRIAEVNRKTSETDIKVSLNLDGSGVGKITTGLGFYDHMLEQLVKHGGLDMTLTVEGDLVIDEHHTIEDTALAIGEAFLQALGSKKGVERYGFTLPMDDCLAQVAIDFGGRPWLVWDVEFKREKVGEMPTEMFFHFFKSFSDAAKCNINIKAEGTNEHHKIESIFKAFAKSIRFAIQQTNSLSIPSTKGVL